MFLSSDNIFFFTPYMLFFPCSQYRCSFQKAVNDFFRAGNPLIWNDARKRLAIVDPVKAGVESWRPDSSGVS